MKSKPPPEATNSIRGLADPVGFAHESWQMDILMEHIESRFRVDLERTEQDSETVWKIAISPHDDYACASWLYPAVLRNIAAKTVIIFGVAHKARSFNLENRLVFDNYDVWQSPYGSVNVSSLREQILRSIPEEMAMVHPEMQIVEHSAEALIAFLQYYNRDVEIVSILVPDMNLERMQAIGQELAETLSSIMVENNLQWGEDVALLITSDAVHYGDEDWGGNNYAPFGTDSEGTAHAMAHEAEIIKACFTGEMTPEKVAGFYRYTLNPDDFREYKWTWCGRYSIPVGLLTAIHLQRLTNGTALTGVPLAYATSINQTHIKVDDLGMGLTNITTRRHWVGYPAIGFR